jgi:hypothetical protein
MPEIITRIRVGSNTIGIIGLKHHLSDVVESHGNASDAEIIHELFTRLKRRNYIVPPATERELKSLLGVSS